jgi:hypothetical protein
MKNGCFWVVCSTGQELVCLWHGRACLSCLRLDKPADRHQRGGGNWEFCTSTSNYPFITHSQLTITKPSFGRSTCRVYLPKARRQASSKFQMRQYYNFPTLTDLSGPFDVPATNNQQPFSILSAPGGSPTKGGQARIDIIQQQFSSK